MEISLALAQSQSCLNKLPQTSLPGGLAQGPGLFFGACILIERIYTSSSKSKETVFAICSASTDISSKGLVPEVSIPPSISGVQPGELYSQGNDQLPKVRKPYTITKQREKWTEDEHKKFLEALKLYGRAWRKIEEHIGTKTAVQIRSHAQKFFTKVVRETASNRAGSSNTIEIPPPRPKRKPAHPYPRKLTNICKKELSVALPESRYPSVPSAMGSSGAISSVIQQENGSPLSASSATGFDPTEPNQVNCQSPVSSVEGSNPPSSMLSEQENGFPSSSSSSASFSPLGLSVHGEYNASSSPVPKSNESSWQYQPSTNVDSSGSNAAEVVPAKETDDGCASKSFLSETKTMSLKLFGQMVFVTDCQLPSATASTPSMTGDQQSSASAFGEEDSAENSAGDENDPIQNEIHLTCQPQILLEKSSPLQDPVEDSSCKSTWNSLRSGVPQMFYCLQYPQKDPNLEGVAIAPWCAVYGNFPFFVQSAASNDPSNSNDTEMPRGTGGVANLDLSGESRHLAMPEVDNNKERRSPTGSGTALASERGAVAGRFSFSKEEKLGCRNSGLFNRIRNSGKGFVPYRRCIAETSTEEMPPLDGHKEEKRIRLCL